MTIENRVIGSLLGLAIGDALGSAVEFKPPGSFKPVSDMEGGGPHHLKVGRWTDDTSMALCLARSLINCGGFDEKDQMERYRRWFREGYLSSTGRCFDIGNATRAAIIRYEETGDPFSGSKDPWSAGNGSIMRLAPVPLYFYQSPEEAVNLSAKSSLLTHCTPSAIDACRYLGALIIGVLEGRSKDQLLSSDFNPADNIWQKAPLCAEIEEIRAGSFKIKEPPDITGSGYVVRTLEAALWAFYKTDNFRDGLLKVVNLGEDADTTGAVYGQLAGAYYGAGAIPDEWVKKLYRADYIIKIARRLMESSESAMKASLELQIQLPI